MTRTVYEKKSDDKKMTERPSLAFSPEFSIFPPHVSLDTIVVPGDDRDDRDDRGDDENADVVVECRSYGLTCWATAGGDTAKEACGKIVAFAHAIGLEPPVPSLTRLATANEHRGDAVENDACRPVRVFARVDVSSPLARYATRSDVAFSNVVGVFFQPRGIAVAMPFEGKLVGDEEVRRRARIFRRALARSRIGGLRDRDVLFASYDASTKEKFVRRNEMLVYL